LPGPKGLAPLVRSIGGSPRGPEVELVGAAAAIDAVGARMLRGCSAARANVGSMH
jgi:hypothetical protein